MWSAKTIIFNIIGNKAIQATTEYFNDNVSAYTISDSYSDIEGYKRDVFDHLKLYDDLTKLGNNPLIQVGDEFTLESFKIDPILPTPKELEEQFYNLKRQELIQAKQDLDLKLIDQQAYDAVVTEVINIKP